MQTPTAPKRRWPVLLAVLALAPQLLSAAPVLQYLGRYESQNDGPDHLQGSAIVNSSFLAVASSTGLALVPRAAVEASTVETHAGKYLVDSELPSNLDGATHGPMFFQVATQATTAYVAARYDGLWILDLQRAGPTWTVTEVGRHMRPREFTEAVKVLGRRLYLTHHGDGIEVMDISDPHAPVSIAVLRAPLVDAWGIAPQRNGDLWVADGAGGLKLARFAGGDLRIVAGDTLATSPGTALDADVVGPWIVAATAGRGVTVYDAATVTQGETVALPGVCVDVAPISATRFAAACRSWVHVLEVTPGGSIARVASVRLHRRLRGTELTTHLGAHVTVSGDTLYVSAWGHLDAYRLVEKDLDHAPDLQASSQRVHFAFLPGVAQTATIDLDNAGQGTLAITDVVCSGGGVTCAVDRTTLAAGTKAVLTVGYDGLTQNTIGSVDVVSNDPDDPVLQVLVFAALARQVDPLESAPLFSGPALRRDYELGTTSEAWLSLAEFATAGEAVAFLVFGSWCPACLPVAASLAGDLEERLPEGARLFVVDQGETRQLVEHLLEKMYLPYPIFLDQDAVVGRELYEQLQVGLPFSRAFVVDPQGQVALVSTSYDPNALLAALEAALP